ncbi:MAG: sugar ABC transporter ATP-binding protein [Treponema sp.]|jgi:ribose transport system ATP-binding protein|nr:sugar ABC transporter ATP-binding protein [Treponema sp.]
METILELKNISKSYSGITVLDNVSVGLEKGEVLCLVGENGAGKSTMIKIMAGVIAPDKAGAITAFGNSYDRLYPRQAKDLGIAAIYQDIDLVDNLTVADNIFLGGELKKKNGLIDTKTQEKISDELLHRLKISKIKGEMILSDLSTAQKQCVQIVKALKDEAKVLILDEPTASLGDEETRILLDMVTTLAKSGMGIIYISHYIDELFKVGSRLMILKDGRMVDIKKVSETNAEEVIHAMIGRDTGSFYFREYFPLGEGALEIRNFSQKKTVHDVSLTIRQGEVFGLGGLVGAGRTELIRMIYGCDKNRYGMVILNGRDITPKNPRDAIKKGIFMIFEDRKRDGLFTLRSVKENITVSANEKKEFIDLKKETKTVENSIKKFGIKMSGQETEVVNLSGGNQQKTLIARCVLDPGTLYIFDEPTKGVDIGAKEEIYKHILDLAKAGKYIILVSSDMPELISMSDHIGIMREGRLVGIVPAKDATESELMRKYLGF